jgi:hypothetical protein
MTGDVQIPHVLLCLSSIWRGVDDHSAMEERLLSGSCVLGKANLCLELGKLHQWLTEFVPHPN